MNKKKKRTRDDDEKNVEKARKKTLKSICHKAPK